MPYFDGLVQERCNSIANALELCFLCSNDGLVQERRNSIANALELRLLSLTNQYDYIDLGQYWLM